MLGTIAGIGVGCVAYGTFIESSMFRLRRYELPLLPDGHESIRILHFTDVHATTYYKRRLVFLESLADLAPDLVISTGDNHAFPNADEPLLRSLDRLLDIPGYFVYGSNDYQQAGWKNPLTYLSGKRSTTPREAHTDVLRENFEARGWTYLAHRRDVITIKGTTIELRGTDDAHIDRANYADVAGPASPGVDLSLGLTHAPYVSVLDAMARDDVDLLVAGHTHGGQVCVPGYGAIVSNCDLPPKLAKGLFAWQGMHVEISAGLGFSPFAPFRFACPPEASLITLTSA